MWRSRRREMSLLYIWLLFFAYVGASSGNGECTGPGVTVFVAPGGSVLLQLDQSERALCPEKCLLQVTQNSTYRVAKTYLPTSEARTECTSRGHNCHVLTNGSLELSNVTPNISGNYTVRLESDGTCKLEKFFRVHIQDPVSVPQMNYTCQRNSSVQLSCFVESGIYPSYSWHVDGTPIWTLTQEILTEYKSVLRHVTCTVKNKVSEKQSEPTNVTCPVPVSEPKLQFTCFASGVIELCCRVENGTGVSYSWSLNGTCCNNSTSCRNITVNEMALYNVTCTAWNLVSERTSQPVNVTCPETPTPTLTPTSTPTPAPTTVSTDFTSTWSPAVNSTGNSSAKGCKKRTGFTCVQWSAIGAASILAVTVVPLIIGVLCTAPRKAN